MKELMLSIIMCLVMTGFCCVAVLTHRESVRYWATVCARNGRSIEYMHNGIVGWNWPVVRVADEAYYEIMPRPTDKEIPKRVPFKQGMTLHPGQTAVMEVSIPIEVQEWAGKPTGDLCK